MTSPPLLLQRTTWFALLMGACSIASGADALVRDPMQAPAGAPPAVRAEHSHTPDAAVAPEAAVRHLMVIDGRRYVIEGGQRLEVGDRLGDARIERIDDGAVWLRDARGLRQVSLFGGIVKRPVADDESVRSAAAPALRRNASAARGPSANGAVRSATNSVGRTVGRTVRRHVDHKATAARSPQALAAMPAAPDSSPSPR